MLNTKSILMSNTYITACTCIPCADKIVKKNYDPIQNKLMKCLCVCHGQVREQADRSSYIILIERLLHQVDTTTVNRLAVRQESGLQCGRHTGQALKQVKKILTAVRSPHWTSTATNTESRLQCGHHTG